MSCEYIEENFIHFFSYIKPKKRADKNNSHQHNTSTEEKRKEIFLRMLVVLKPIKCELEIAKGVRAKGEASVTERDVVFNAAREEQR